ncbi:MAG: ABC transporter permease [Proteobacteria bacterium]|nr:ABC transporter permease [Pseudomonadota bacterium]
MPKRPSLPKAVQRLIPMFSRRALRRVIRIYFRGPANVFAAAVIFAALFCALFADLIAADLPIACRLNGELHILPALTRDGALAGYDNQRIAAEVAQNGGWTLAPPIPYGPEQMKCDGDIQWLEAPSRQHLLGTDDNGRDVLARLIHGFRTALLVGLGSMLLGASFGIALGALAAWFGGHLDRIARHMTQTFTIFPALFLILAIQGLLGKGSLWQLVFLIAATCWTDVARATRAEMLRVANEPYVEAARALGLGHIRILRRYMIPVIKGPILVSATFSVASAMVIESTLSFIGYGVAAPTASWGGLLRDALYSEAQGVLMFAPGIALTCLVLAVNLVSEGLSEALDRT